MDYRTVPPFCTDLFDPTAFTFWTSHNCRVHHSLSPPAADLVEKLAHDRLFFFSLDCDLFHVYEANIGTQ